MKLLKITTQGLINITNTEVISYNRAAILKEGWRLKRTGIKDGLAQAWEAARTQMNNLKELIAETEQERVDYIEDYSMAYEVAGDLISDGIEPEEGPMADALHDYKEMVQVMEEMGFLKPQSELEEIFQQLVKEYLDENKEETVEQPKSFAEIQKERLKKLLEEVV
nr:MAG: hypothetical protein [Bacteriophage sp.]